MKSRTVEKNVKMWVEVNSVKADELERLKSRSGFLDHDVRLTFMQL